MSHLVAQRESISLLYGKSPLLRSITIEMFLILACNFSISDLFETGLQVMKLRLVVVSSKHWLDTKSTWIINPELKGESLGQQDIDALS